MQAKDSWAGRSPNWHITEYPRAMADVLNGSDEVWRKLASVSQLRPRLIERSQGQGLQLELQIFDESCQMRLESDGCLFLDAIFIDFREDLSEFLTACIRYACSDMHPLFESLRVCSISLVRETQIRERYWNLGKYFLRFQSCSERLASILTSESALPRPLPVAISIPTHFKLWQTKWDTAHWRTMRVGDAVLMPFSAEAWFHASWWWGIGEYKGYKVAINFGEKSMRLDDELGNSMSIEGGDETVGDDDLVQFGDVELSVSFEMDSGRFSFKKLRNLQLGQIFPLDVDPKKCRIKLVSGGQCLAQGYLIQVDQTLAVCLDRIGSQNAKGVENV